MLKLLATMPEWILETSASVDTLHTTDVGVDALIASIAGVEDRLPSIRSTNSIVTITRKISQAQFCIQLVDREAEQRPNDSVDHMKTAHRRSEQDDMLKW